MTVFTSRIRRAYLRRRSARAQIFGLLIFLAILAACGIAGRHELRDRQSMSDAFSPALCSRVVATWSEVPIIPSGN